MNLKAAWRALRARPTPATAPAGWIERGALDGLANPSEPSLMVAAFVDAKTVKGRSLEPVYLEPPHVDVATIHDVVLEMKIFALGNHFIERWAATLEAAVGLGGHDERA